MGIRIARAVFYFEVMTNSASAGFALFLPERFLGGFAAQPIPVTVVEFGRWYAVLLVVLSLVLWAALRAGTDRFLRPVISAYLVGDVLQIGVAIRFGRVAETFPLVSHAAIWTSVFYAAVRIFYLWCSNPRRTSEFL
jgi:hypothetical protein